jgi:hypothetical protein
VTNDVVVNVRQNGLFGDFSQSSHWSGGNPPSSPPRCKMSRSSYRGHEVDNNNDEDNDDNNGGGYGGCGGGGEKQKRGTSVGFIHNCIVTLFSLWATPKLSSVTHVA